MKRSKYVWLIPVLFVGVGLFLAGLCLQTVWLIVVGAAVFFLAAVWMSVVAWKIRLRQARELAVRLEEDGDMAECCSKLSVNTTSGYENRRNLEVRKMAHFINVWKNASCGERVRGVLGIALILAGMAAFVVLLSLEYEEWAFAVFGLEFAGLFLTIVIAGALRKRRLSGRNAEGDDEVPFTEAVGTVVSCVISEESTLLLNSSAATQRGRILRTTYRVSLDVEGEKKVAYSREFYRKGERLRVYYRPGSSIAMIGKSEEGV